MFRVPVRHSVQVVAVVSTPPLAPVAQVVPPALVLLVLALRARRMCWRFPPALQVPVVVRGLPSL